jgi:hypothetical protein
MQISRIEKRGTDAEQRSGDRKAHEDGFEDAGITTAEPLDS